MCPGMYCNSNVVRDGSRGRGALAFRTFKI